MIYAAIVIATIIGSIVLAKRGRGKNKFRRYLKAQVEVQADLSTLAGKVAIAFTGLGSPVVQEQTWVSSVKATWSLSNLTEAFSAGPIVVGVAHSDYTSAEIEAWLENQGSWSQGDLVAQEVAKRKIRQVGVFGTPAQALGIVDLNDGRNITTKCGWMLTTGQSIKYWAYNSGATALATTAAELIVKGHANLWPR